MTDTDTHPAKKPNKFWLEFGPLLVFVIAYQYMRRTDVSEPMLKAAGIFMILAVISLIFAKIRYDQVSKVLVFTTLIIVVTAGLAILSGNPVIFYMKPTILNALFGIGVIGGVMMKKNVIQMFLGEAFEMPVKAWNNLAIRWGVFFFAMAALNEFIWRNFDENFWVNFKLFGFVPITLLFSLSQMPFIFKHGKVKGMEEEAG